MIYYNDSDRHCCAWLRELQRDGQIREGRIDERPIEEVEPADVAGYDVCHWFAGIGGWEYALRLAGWVADDAGTGRGSAREPSKKGDEPGAQQRLARLRHAGPIWTASCPCQPFSSAGKRRGFADERHLWPVLFRLVGECRPAMVVGEQVGGGPGRQWLARVFADLESAGYACAAADLPAACVGAPHIRQRLFWVAVAGSEERRSRPTLHLRPGRQGADAAVNAWAAGRAISCLDGAVRRIPTEPALFPLADGLPGRLVALRGAGNAIVPQVAAVWLEAIATAGRLGG